jgi:hypothetical protein
MVRTSDDRAAGAGPFHFGDRTKVGGGYFVRNARWIRTVSVMALSFSLAGFIGLAVTERGAVAGAVLDDHGGPLPGARVEIAGPSRMPPAKSEGMGFFHFTALAAGEYTVTVSHPAFSSTAQRVVVRSGETTTMSVQLRERH